MKPTQIETKHPMRNWRTVFAIAIAVAVTGIALYCKDDLLSALDNLQPEWILAGLAFYLLTYFFRAQRLKILSDNQVAIWPDSIYCASLHGFATYMLPFRSGDLTLPVLLKTMSGMDMAEGVKILYKARLLDLFTLGIWSFSASVFPYWEVPGYVRSSLCLLGVIMISAPYLLHKLFLYSALGDGIVAKVAKTLGSVGRLGGGEIFQSACIWGALAACFYCIAKSIGLSLHPGAIWLLIVIQMPLQLIPLQGLANSGNHEGGWVAGLKLLGISTEAALEFALLSHAILLLYVLSIGPVALVAGLFYWHRCS